MADLVTIKARQQQTWAQGDYMLMSADLVLVSELLCETVDLRAGQTVLDVATGSGNTALAAARRRCDVIGIDYTPTLLALGQARAATERLPVTFRDGDAEQLPFADATFDVVLSTFGVMFAPDQEQAAHELLRVCRPGGKIGLASWTPESFPGAFRQVMAQYLPPPPGVASPLRWGTEAGLHELFGTGIVSLQVTQRSIAQRYMSAQHCVEHLRTHFGPVVAAFAALDAEHQAQLMRAMVEEAQRFNRSGDETFMVPSDYLEAVAIKR
jgi:ubiquinone/menaquinone biosynthesis C-methylase UbiE